VAPSIRSRRRDRIRFFRAQRGQGMRGSLLPLDVVVDAADNSSRAAGAV
jgi:hypothetical protein